MAASKGPFAGYAQEPRADAAGDEHAPRRGLRDRSRPRARAEALYRAACEDWDAAVRLGEEHGYRNAQATVLAPTGTIGLLMDCDTTGIEPDFALVKFKKLAGGGYFKIVNQSVPARAAPPRLRRARGAGDRRLHLRHQHAPRGAAREPPTLKRRGSATTSSPRSRRRSRGVFDLDLAFGAWVLGEETYDRLGATQDPRAQRVLAPRAPRLHARARSTRRATTIIGRMTIEGAPHLRDGALRSLRLREPLRQDGQRFLAPMSHVQMMAATQPFLSGAISKTVNLPQRGHRRRRAIDLRGGVAAGAQGRRALPRRLQGEPAALDRATRRRTRRGEKKPNRRATARAHAPDDAQATQQLTLPIAPKAPAFTDSAAPAEEADAASRRRRASGDTRFSFEPASTTTDTLGEIFIDMHKEGAAFRSLMNCFAMASPSACSTACRSRRTSISSRSRASSRRGRSKGIRT